MARSIQFLHSLSRLLGPLAPPRTALQRRTLRQQQGLLVGQSLNMGLVNIVNGLIVISLFFESTPGWRLAVWYAPILCFGILQISLYRRLHGRRVPARVSGRFLRRAEYTAVLIAFWWGAAIHFLPVEASLSQLLTLVVIQCGMVAGVAALLTTLPRMVLRFSVICVVLMAAGLVVHREPALTAMIFPALAYMTALISASLVSFTQMTRMHQAQVDVEQARTDLADAIESVGDGFAIVNTAGELALANSRHRSWFGEGEELPAIGKEEPRMMRDGSWIIPSVHPMRNGGQVILHSDVTALKKRERELIDARREAEIADETKTRFLNTMSHELRTPLNVIIGFSRLLNQTQDRSISADEREKYAAHIHQSAEHLLRLISDIIDYSRSGLDEFDLQADIIGARELIDAAIRMCQDTNEDAEDVALDMRIDPRIENLVVDAGAIGRVLQALVSNAIKFRGRRHDISIRASLSRSRQPMITVRDFGIGMSKQQLEHAFDAFYQGDNGLNRDFAGAGLGLTLAQHLARLHGGEILLRSRQNVGTAATLVLPASTLPRAANSTTDASGEEPLDLTG